MLASAGTKKKDKNVSSVKFSKARVYFSKPFPLFQGLRF